MKLSRKNKLFIDKVGSLLSSLDDGRPEQTIQEQWGKFINEEDYSYEKYQEFLAWADDWKNKRIWIKH